MTKKSSFCQLIFRLTPLASADKKELFLVIQNYALLSYLEWPLECNSQKRLCPGSNKRPEATSRHSHFGRRALMSVATTADLKKMWEVATQFRTGDLQHAERACRPLLYRTLILKI